MPRPFGPRGTNPVSVLQEAGWAPGPVWTSAGTSSVPAFNPWTVQAIVNRYTDYATPAPTASADDVVIGRNI